MSPPFACVTGLFLDIKSYSKGEDAFSLHKAVTTNLITIRNEKLVYPINAIDQRDFNFRDVHLVTFCSNEVSIFYFTFQ